MSDVSIVGDYAIAAGSVDGMHVIDISTPGSESIIHSVDPINQNISLICVKDGYAYALGNLGMTGSIVNVIDIDPPESAAVKYKLYLGMFGADMDVQDNYLYIAAHQFDPWEERILVVDIQDPETAFVEKSMDIPRFVEAIDVDQNFLYVVDTHGLRIYQLW